MKKIYLLLGFHNHQPVGNLPRYFEEGYRRAYLPFVEVLERHPEVKASFHYSGSLWEWIGKHRPDFFPKLRRLIRRKQIEILGGGFYEPLLPLIPPQDARGQIEMMNRFLLKTFQQSPRGFWLTERVWEPSLPRLVKGTGLKYTVVDDTHFFSGGLSAPEVNNYFLTEDQGNPLYIFPIDMRLRYLVPFHPLRETIDYLKKARDRGVRALTIFDDGEKFGLWPGSHQWVYGKKWLERFLTEIKKHSAWLGTATFSEYLSENEANGVAYLPTSSYEEMTHWVLSPGKGREMEDFISYLKSQGLYEQFRPLLAGGFFRNFLRKYPEAKNLYDRMLLTSHRLNSLKRKGSAKPLAEGLRSLYQGQNNDAYWHGIFGGLYLAHLRKAVYTNLIRAEIIGDGLRGAKFPRVIEKDLNSDGHQEVLVETKYLNVFISPRNGGSIYEMDYKSRSLNLTDIISRREETYHEKMRDQAAKKGSQKHLSIHNLKKALPAKVAKCLNYDQYTHTTLLDHILPLSTRRQDFSLGRLSWLGSTPAKRTYQTRIRREKDWVSVSLTGEEGISRAKGLIPLTIEKEIRIYSHRPGLDYRYTLINQGEERLSFLFLVEFCFANPEKSSTFKGKHARVAFCDPPFELELESDNEAEWWKVPLRTVSQSAGTFDFINQGILYLPHFKVSLGKQEVFRFQIKERIAG